MKKILIAHNSRFGNSKLLGEQIGERLSGKFEVSIENIKEINPEDFVKNLYGLILAARIIAFRVNGSMKKFVKKIDSIREDPIPKIAVYYTHCMNWKESFKKSMDKTIEKANNLGNQYSEYLQVQMAKNQGPAVDGQKQKINDFINNLEIYLEN